MGMESGPKSLMLLGAVLLVAGLVWQFGGNFLHLGKLPGDIRIERDNFRFYFPLTTGILISLILTLILNLAGRMGK